MQQALEAVGRVFERILKEREAIEERGTTTSQAFGILSRLLNDTDAFYGVVSGSLGPTDEGDFPFLFVTSTPPVKLTELPPPPQEENPTNFDEWMKQVDDTVLAMAGYSTFDLSDCDYRSLFDGGATPSEAADKALTEAGFDRFV